MSESNVNFPIIEVLVLEGYHIVTLINSLKEIQYWSTYGLDPNTSGSEGVEFVQFQGVNMTDFMKKAPPTSNVKEVVSQFEKWIENKPKLFVKLPKYSEWQFYTM